MLNTLCRFYLLTILPIVGCAVGAEGTIDGVTDGTEGTADGRRVGDDGTAVGLTVGAPADNNKYNNRD